MKETLQQHKKKIHDVDVKKEKQSEPYETRINEILSRYFVWLINNNIGEFQIFCKFWNQRFTN